MWLAHARGWRSLHFRIEADGDPLATLTLGTWRERSTLTLGKRTLWMTREGGWRRMYFLKERAQTLATAWPPTFFARGLVLLHEGEEYALVPTSFFSRHLELRRRGRSLARIRSHGFLGRRVTLDLDESLEPTLPPEVRAFILWLSILTWNRGSAAAAAAS